MSEIGSPQGFPNISQPIAGPGGTISRPWLLLLVALWNRTGGAMGISGVPTGTVMDFAGPVANIPDGWLACGQAVSRAQYANLFGIIGTTWGPGDSTTTFDLPPQNVFAKGVGMDNVGDTGGAGSVTISIAQLPAHNHGVTDPGHTHVVTDPKHTHTVTDPGHAHTITDPGHNHTALVTNAINTTGTSAGASQAGNTGNAATGITVNSATTGVTNQTAATGISNQTATTGISTQNTGTGSAVSILPPYATFLKMIKT